MHTPRHVVPFNTQAKKVAERNEAIHRSEIYSSFLGALHETMVRGNQGLAGYRFYGTAMAYMPLLRPS